MKALGILLLCLAFMWPSANAAGLHFNDEFKSLNEAYWCPCQMDMQKAPIAFQADPDDKIDRTLIIPVDKSILGENNCEVATECEPPPHTLTLFPAEDSMRGPYWPEPFGGSFDQLFTGDKLAIPQETENPYCTPEVMERVSGDRKKCIQRQELRIQSFRRPRADQPHLYSFRFRMAPELKIVDRNNSIRWVTAQWKQEPIHPRYRPGWVLGPYWGPSPFLSQRLDNGVLHVAVADEHCRCTVASAPMPEGPQPEWRDGDAEYCVSTITATTEQACSSSLKVEYGDEPVLPNPFSAWVEMTYRVQVDRSGDAFIEVYADDKFIVRVTGKIGYEPPPDKPSYTKFKIGHYRDYMPFAHVMEVDWLRIEPASK